MTLATAKNNKERTLEVSEIPHRALPPGAAVPRTEPEVLKHIKRKNLPLEVVVEVTRTTETDGAGRFSAVILCLPGDSKTAHLESLKSVLNAGFTFDFVKLA